MSQTTDQHINLESPLLTVTKMITEAHIRAEERARAAHERFNIFTTLLAESDEVRLHTRFLHCLLDPKGCHDCGSLFLDLFLVTLNENPGLDDKGEPVPLNTPRSEGEWRVGKEVSCPPHGQIDILLERAGIKIAIENKINAGEQPDQLAGYSEFLHKRPADITRLIYLTKDGKKSETHKGAPYIRISYANHILAWLEKCLRESYGMVPITQGLLQYREVVRRITGKTIQSAAMKPIAEFIENNPNIIRFRRQIAEATNAACANYFNRLADGIKAELQNEFKVRPHEHRKFGADKNGSLILVAAKLPFEIYIEYDMGECVVAVGISGAFNIKPPSAEDANLFKKMDALLKAEADTSGYEKPNATTNWPAGWFNVIEGINDEVVANLIEAGLSKTVSEVCEKIRNHISLLERIYSEAKSTTPA